MAIYETLYPQGNFLDIRANAPTSTDYNIQVMEDLVRNLPGGGIRDLLAPAAAATLSLPYDAIQAATRTTEDDISRAMETAGMYGPKDIASEAYGLAFGRERPLSSAIERTIGASGPLAERINNLNLFNSAVAAEKPTVPNLSLDYNMPTFDLATGITNTSAGLPFRSMADMQEAANKDLVQQIIEQNVNKLAPVTSSVMYDEFPQGFSFRPQAPRSLGFDTSYGVASEPDVEQEALPGQKTQGGGIGGLLKFLVGLAVPGAGFLMNLPGRGLEGIRSLNQRLRATDFGQSKTLQEYFQRREARKDAERLQTVEQQLQQASERSGGYQPTSKAQNIARTESRRADKGLGQGGVYGL